MIVRDFLICLLQMYLLEDLEKNMLPYRRENFWGKFLVYFVVALIMLGINHLESSIFNMVMIPVTYMIVSMVVFRGNIWKKLVIVCCYYVLAIIPEFLFATLTNAYGVTGASEGFGTEIEKTLALLLMSTMTFLFIKCINQVTRKRDYLTIEKKTCINVSAELLEATFEIYQHGFKGANVELPFYSGDICYLSACEEQKYFFADKNQNLEMWNDICLGEFEVINVPGNHVTCIHSEENATLLAQIIIERNIRG